MTKMTVTITAPQRTGKTSVAKALAHVLVGGLPLTIDGVRVSNATEIEAIPSSVEFNGDVTEIAIVTRVESRKSVLELAREYDVVDSGGELMRRLNAAEPLDEACKGALEKRVAIAVVLEDALGGMKDEFEKALDYAQTIGQVNPAQYAAFMLLETRAKEAAVSIDVDSRVLEMETLLRVTEAVDHRNIVEHWLLEKLQDTATHSMTRRSITVVLARTRLTSAAQVVLLMLLRSDRARRADAALIFSGMKDIYPQVRGFLVDSLRDENVDVRRQAVLALAAQCDDLEVRSRITRMIKDPDPGVRFQVALHLSRLLDYEDARKALVSLLWDYPDAQTKIAEAVAATCAPQAGANGYHRAHGSPGCEVDHSAELGRTEAE